MSVPGHELQLVVQAQAELWHAREARLDVDGALDLALDDSAVRADQDVHLLNHIQEHLTNKHESPDNLNRSKTRYLISPVHDAGRSPWELAGDIVRDVNLSLVQLLSLLRDVSTREK